MLESCISRRCDVEARLIDLLTDIFFTVFLGSQPDDLEIACYSVCG